MMMKVGVQFLTGRILGRRRGKKIILVKRRSFIIK